MSSSCCDFYKKKVENLTKISDALDAAILAITEDGVSSYELDTGKNCSRVTKHNLPQLIDRLETINNQICKYQTQYNQCIQGLSSGAPTLGGACW
jgi:conjugal transfer/entry exclusion protein